MVPDMKRNAQKTPGIRKGTKPDTYRIDYYDWDKTHRTKIFHGTHSDAVKLRRSFLARADRIKNGLELPPEREKRPTKMCELWDAFHETYNLKVTAGSIEQTSLDRYKWSVNAFFEYDNSLENRVLSRINEKDFEGFKSHRRSLGYSPNGINTNLRNLRTIFNYGKNKGYMDKNPMEGLGYIKTPNHDVRYLNEDELSTLNSTLKSLDQTNFIEKDAHDLTLFYLYTGARTSEILYPYFSWDCITKNRIKFPHTKTNKERVISLTRGIEKILNSRQNIIGGPFFKESCPVDSENDPRTQYLTRDMVYNRTKYVFNKAGLNDISTHSLRKTAGAFYYIATRDIFATSRFLGHSSVKVTELHYVGLIQSLQMEYSHLFDSILTNNLEKPG
ncbi:tyrosine-type recombinase/integrase [Caldithrix abyssi]|nr:tyrosine-type recombinase/integrase [Caldithrix abyssi]